MNTSSKWQQKIDFRKVGLYKISIILGFLGDRREFMKLMAKALMEGIDSLPFSGD